MLKLLHVNKNFRNYWFACSINSMGDFVDDIALAQLVYIITKSTLLTSYVFAIKIIFTFISMFTSVIADHCNQKNILITMSLLQGMSLAILIILYHFDLLNILLLFCFITLQSIFSTFSIPAKNALLPTIVDVDDLVNASSSMSIVMQFIQMISYAYAGFLISFIGIDGAMIFDSITFFISVIFMKNISISEYTISAKISSFNFYEELRAGFNFVIKEKIVFFVMIFTFFGNLFSAPTESLMPAYFSQSNFPIESYSIYMICIASGGIIGSFILSKISKNQKLYLLLSLGFAIGGIGIMGLYFNFNVYPYVFSFLIGISIGFVSILNATIIQLKTPKHMMARVFSIFKCLSYLASPVGIVLAGFLGELLPMHLVFFPFGICLFFTALASISFLKEKNYIV